MMAQMVQAPIEGYEDAIVVPPINANNFELKQTVINLVQSNQFTGRQDPHNHLRFFNKVTSTFRHPEVPNTTIAIRVLVMPTNEIGEFGHVGWGQDHMGRSDKYCPRNEMKKIETEFWNLEVQGTDVMRYNQRFQELALMCLRTCPEESDRVERYIGGLPDSIHESVAASKPKTMQEATEMATGLMDKKIRTYAERQAANKRKFEDTSQNNQGRQQPPKRQDEARAYAAGSGNRQQYAGSRPLCPKCNFNHDGPCTPRC
nr:reverse transcriptase domain-containing protein [Tanacetum cinerariifolium]